MALSLLEVAGFSGVAYNGLLGLWLSCSSTAGCWLTSSTAPSSPEDSSLGEPFLLSPLGLSSLPPCFFLVWPTPRGIEMLVSCLLEPRAQLKEK